MALPVLHVQQAAGRATGPWVGGGGGRRGRTRWEVTSPLAEQQAGRCSCCPGSMRPAPHAAGRDRCRLGKWGRTPIPPTHPLLQDRYRIATSAASRRPRVPTGIPAYRRPPPQWRHLGNGRRRGPPAGAWECFMRDTRSRIGLYGAPLYNTRIRLLPDAGLEA